MTSAIEEIIYNLVGAIDLPDFGDLLDEEKLPDDMKIITTQDYIDSTLLMQINSIQIQDK